MIERNISPIAALASYHNMAYNTAVCAEGKRTSLEVDRFLCDININSLIAAKKAGICLDNKQADRSIQILNDKKLGIEKKIQDKEEFMRSATTGEFKNYEYEFNKEYVHKKTGNSVDMLCICNHAQTKKSFVVYFDPASMLSLTLELDRFSLQYDKKGFIG